jgi:hypothetical protein
MLKACAKGHVLIVMDFSEQLDSGSSSGYSDP